MSTISFLMMAAVLVLLQVGALSQVRKLWTGRGHMGKSAPSWWIWGSPLWRGWRRAVPLGIGFMPFFLSAVIAGFFLSENGSKDLPTLFDAAFLGFSFTFGLLLVTIALFNRPKILVPPPYRKEPGAWKEWSRKM